MWITYRGNAEAAEALAASVPGARTAQCDLHRSEDMARLAVEVRSVADHVATLVHAAVEIVTGPALESDTKGSPRWCSRAGYRSLASP